MYIQYRPVVICGVGLLKLIISAKVAGKLAKKHNVTEDEIVECFANRTAGFLLDEREYHKTEPPTRWFVAETNRGRLLKVVFVPTNGIFIKTAYEANADEIRIYNSKA